MSAGKFTLEVLPGTYAVCRLDADVEVPDWVSGAVTSVTRAPGELSVICSQDVVPGDVTSESGWSCLQMYEISMDFS